MRIRRALKAPVLAAFLLTASFAFAEETPKDTKSEQAEKPRIRLKWSTSTEVDNYGFLVHRGEKEVGPFKVMTPKVLPGAGNSEVPQSYTWDDHDVVMGNTYYYWLESISTQGVKEKFSPILARKCCKVPGAQGGTPGATGAGAEPAKPEPKADKPN